MSIRVTVNLIVDDEAGNQIEQNAGNTERIVAEFIKRLTSSPVEDILLHIVDIEDVW